MREHRYGSRFLNQYLNVPLEKIGAAFKLAPQLHFETIDRVGRNIRLNAVRMKQYQYCWNVVDNYY